MTAKGERGQKELQKKLLWRNRGQRLSWGNSFHHGCACLLQHRHPMECQRKNPAVKGDPSQPQVGTEMLEEPGESPLLPLTEEG